MGSEVMRDELSHVSSSQLVFSLDPFLLPKDKVPIVEDSPAGVLSYSRCLNYRRGIYVRETSTFRLPFLVPATISPSPVPGQHIPNIEIRTNTRLYLDTDNLREQYGPTKQRPLVPSPRLLLPGRFTRSLPLDPQQDPRDLRSHMRQSEFNHLHTSDHKSRLLTHTSSCASTSIWSIRRPPVGNQAIGLAVCDE